MEQFMRVFIVFLLTTVFFKCFNKASGSLSIYKLNLNSLSFWYLVIFALVGGSAIFLGFRDHYLIRKVEEQYIDKTYFIMMYSIIMLPISIIFFNHLMGIGRYGKFFENYIKKDVVLDYTPSESVFTITVVLSIIGTLALSYTIYIIGYISLFEMFKGNWELMSQRQLISRGFTGNEYIRNIFALGLIPNISYLAYIYYQKTNKFKWKILFFYLFIMSIICKTYNFEKAPIVIYFCYFYLIDILIGKKNDFLKIAKYLIPSVFIILIFYYVASNYDGSLFSFSTGPISRLFITQISTLFLHIQFFSNWGQFLSGSSFPKSLSWLFGTNDYGKRSARIVMEIYNPSGVASGDAGVMNSLFVGEAFANFGYSGVILAPIIVGFFMTVVPNIILKQKKDPINIALYVMVSFIYTTALVGGFVDFVYNILLIILISIFLGVKLIVNEGKLVIVKGAKKTNFN